MHMKKERGNAADVLGRYEIIIRLQKVVIICLLLFVAILTGACLYFGSLPKSVPWVIELTPQGEATYYPDAVKLLENWTPNDATQRYFIARYVTNLRSVSTDNYQNQTNAGDVYAKSLNNAASLITEWYTDNNPITRSANEYVQVPSEEMSITQYSNTQWKVTWRETTYRRSDGMIIGDKQYEGIFTVAFYTPDTERTKRENPIGMYVVNYDIDLLRNLL